MKDESTAGQRLAQAVILLQLLGQLLQPCSEHSEGRADKEVARGRVEQPGLLYYWQLPV